MGTILDPSAAYYLDLSTFALVRDFEGYTAWSDSLDLGPEPTPEPEPVPPTTPAPVKGFDRDGRRQRGLALLGQRRVVGYGSTYLVEPSKPGDTPYTVVVTPAGNLCDCPDYRYRCAANNPDCQHGHLVNAVIEAARGERRAA